MGAGVNKGGVRAGRGREEGREREKEGQRGKGKEIRLGESLQPNWRVENGNI